MFGNKPKNASSLQLFFGGKVVMQNSKDMTSFRKNTLPLTPESYLQQSTSYCFKLHSKWCHVGVTLPDDFPQKKLYTNMLCFVVIIFASTSCKNVWKDGKQRFCTRVVGCHGLTYNTAPKDRGSNPRGGKKNVKSMFCISSKKVWYKKKDFAPGFGFCSTHALSEIYNTHQCEKYNPKATQV